MAIDAYGVGVDVLARGAAQYFTSADVELCAVPGTGEDFAVEFPLVEGPADMGAVVGKGVDGTIYFCQADGFPIDFDGPEFAIFKIINFRYFHKVCHNKRLPNFGFSNLL